MIVQTGSRWILESPFLRREIELVKTAGVRVVSGHDFGNPRFGVTRAVAETLGEPDDTRGMCWLKRAGE